MTEFTQAQEEIRALYLKTYEEFVRTDFESEYGDDAEASRDMALSELNGINLALLAIGGFVHNDEMKAIEDGVK